MERKLDWFCGSPRVEAAGMALHGIKKDFQTKRGGTLVLFKMERAMGMWNVLVQKKVGQFQMASCMGDLRGGTDCVGLWVPV